MNTKTKLSLSAFALAMSMPISAMAQDTATEDTTQAGNSDLALGEEIVDGGVVGEIYTREEFGDWDMRCVRTADKKDPCQMYQLLQDADGNSVAEISLFQLIDGGAAVAGATIIAPLETLLTEQLTIGVDGGSTKRYPFSWCTTQGCFARIGFTEDSLNGFRRGTSATVSIVPVAAPDKRVVLTLSLSGFTAGYEAVIAANDANAAE